MLNRCTTCYFGVCPFISSEHRVYWLAEKQSLNYISCWVQKLLLVIIFGQALRHCLSANQYAYSLFAADKETDPETAGCTAIENMYNKKYDISGYNNSHIRNRSVVEWIKRLLLKR